MQSCPRRQWGPAWQTSCTSLTKHIASVAQLKGVRAAGWPGRMASPVGPQETGHADTVHDVQLDYYGRKLATASSDRTIKVFDVTGDQLTPLTTLNGHDGPVWQVSWSHPKFGNLLASCSFDNRVMIWKEQQDGSWTPVSRTQTLEGHYLHDGKAPMALASYSGDASRKCRFTQLTPRCIVPLSTASLLLHMS